MSEKGLAGELWEGREGKGREVEKKPSCSVRERECGFNALDLLDLFACLSSLSYVTFITSDSTGLIYL